MDAKDKTLEVILNELDHDYDWDELNCLERGHQKSRREEVQVGKLSLVGEKGN